MTNDCVLDLSELISVFIIKTLVKGVKLMTDRYEKYRQKKGQCKDQEVSKQIHIFSCAIMIAKHLTSTIILTCCQLALTYCPYFCVILTITSVILKSILQ